MRKLSFARCLQSAPLILAALALVVAGHSPAEAKSVTLLSKTYVRDTAKPVVVKDTFKVAKNVTNCQISITTPDGGPLSANNVSVKVNGVEMADDSSLKANTGSQKGGVVLLADNAVEVLLKGKPGDSVTIVITGTEPDVIKPPTPPTPPAPPRPPVAPVGGSAPRPPGM